MKGTIESFVASDNAFSFMSSVRGCQQCTSILEAVFIWCIAMVK